MTRVGTPTPTVARGDHRMRSRRGYLDFGTLNPGDLVHVRTAENGSNWWLVRTTNSQVGRTDVTCVTIQTDSRVATVTSHPYNLSVARNIVVGQTLNWGNGQQLGGTIAEIFVNGIAI